VPKNILQLVELIHNFHCAGFGHIDMDLCLSQIIRVFAFELCCITGFGMGGSKLCVLGFTGLLELLLLTLQISDFLFQFRHAGAGGSFSLKLASRASGSHKRFQRQVFINSFSIKGK
jgi:hypothetical protein